MAVYPVFQAFWILFGTVGSVVLYAPSWNAHGLKTVQKVHYAIAGSLMCIGVYFLLRHRHRSYRDREDALAKADADDDDDSDSEDSETLDDDPLDTIDENGATGVGDNGRRRSSALSALSTESGYGTTHTTNLHAYGDEDVSRSSLKLAATHNALTAPTAPQTPPTRPGEAGPGREPPLSPLPAAPTLYKDDAFHGSEGHINVSMDDLANAPSSGRASAEEPLLGDGARIE